MSVTSMFTAVSGMSANGTGLSVVSDNIANMNTHAFKSSSVVFGDVISQSLGSTGIGRGTLLNDVSAEFSQGAFESSSNVLDMAIDGDGLFVVKKGLETVYTRAGQFGIDKQGYAVNANDYKLQGFQFSVSGASSTVIGDINVSAINSQPMATENAKVYANLDAKETIPVDNFDELNPETTSNFTSTLTVYDSIGNSHVVNIYYRKSVELPSGNTWQWFAVVGANDSQSGLQEIQAGGLLLFNSGGALLDEQDLPDDVLGSPLTTEYHSLSDGAAGGTDFTVSEGFNFSGGATQLQEIDFDFGINISTELGSGLEGSTQFGAASTTSYLDQDGYAAGALKNVTISNDGLMTGIFTNGQTKDIAQIVLAKFISTEGLIKIGKNLYVESNDSGQPIVTAAGSTGTGLILSNTLELSNVDLAEEFVRMIILQRGFQANSKMVTTSDELMMELVNLKR